MSTTSMSAPSSKPRISPWGWAVAALIAVLVAVDISTTMYGMHLASSVLRIKSWQAERNPLYAALDLHSEVGILLVRALSGAFVIVLVLRASCTARTRHLVAAGLAVLLTYGVFVGYQAEQAAAASSALHAEATASYLNAAGCQQLRRLNADPRTMATSGVRWLDEHSGCPAIDTAKSSLRPPTHLAR